MDFSILRAIFEITVLWLIFYQLYRAFKNSRAAAILAGLVVCLFISVVVIELMHASVLKYIATHIIGPGTILVILFQNELRSALARLGIPLLRKYLMNHDGKEDFPHTVADSVTCLASRRHGALIVICRRQKTADMRNTELADGGHVLEDCYIVDAVYSRGLIDSIFWPGTLLHDGAVIVENERVAVARAVLPLSSRELKDPSMGMRHRAGIGIAEITDAVVIIVSEETGKISLAVGNMLQRELSREQLEERLRELLYAHRPNKAAPNTAGKIATNDEHAEAEDHME